MTELEKAKAGNYDAIDFNKLVEQIREEKNNYTQTCRNAVEDSEESFDKIDFESHMKPVIDMQLALNALLMKVGVSEVMIASYAAALGSMKTLLLNISKTPERNKFGCELIEAFLTAHTAMVHISVPNPNKRRADGE